MQKILFHLQLKENPVVFSGAAPRHSGVRSGEAQVLRTLRFSQLRFRRNVPPCGGMCAALMFRRFNVPAARRRPTFRRWITPGYDPGRDSLFLFFLFFIFYPAPPAPRTTGCEVLCVASIRAAWFARSGTAATIKPRQRSGAITRPSGVRSATIKPRQRSGATPRPSGVRSAVSGSSVRQNFDFA